MAVTLDILSDPICPWCLIGKTRLDRALAERPGHPFRIAWHPFQLNPDMPDEGMARSDYMAAKFGGLDRAKAAYAPIVTAAEADGIEIAWDAMNRVPNTLDAHRLIHWAGLEGRQTAAVSALFRAYFQEGRDIGTWDVLIEIASDLEMDPELVARLYSSGADRDAVTERDAHARARGVTGVPTFVVGERHVVPGAQPVDLWLEVIDELAANVE